MMLLATIAGRSRAHRSPSTRPFVCRRSAGASWWALQRRRASSIVFGLNVMTFRANVSSPLVLRNIDALLEYTARANLTVHGFELGNELPKIAPAVCAADYCNLAAALRRHWPSKAPRPKAHRQ